MSTLDTIMGLLGLGSTLTNVSLFRRFLASVALIIAFTAASSTMVGALIVAGFYGLYVAFVHYGVVPAIAVTVLGIFAVSITAVMVSIAVGRWREIRNFQYFSPSPLLGEAGKIADAFVRGLLKERR